MTIGLSELIRWAEERDWKAVDEAILDICNSHEFVDWAINKGLIDGNGDIRDLAASILEKTESKRFDEAIERLHRLMRSYPPYYAGFRAACALANHPLEDRYRGEVIATLKRATEDREEEVRGIAKEYLEKLRR